MKTKIKLYITYYTAYFLFLIEMVISCYLFYTDTTLSNILGAINTIITLTYLFFVLDAGHNDEELIND